MIQMSKKDLDEKKIGETVGEVTGAAEEIEEAAEEKISKWNARRLKYGSMFYIIIILVIAIVVVINIMVNMVAKRSPLKVTNINGYSWNFLSNKRYLFIYAY